MDIKDALNSNQRNSFDIMIGTTKDEYNYWTILLGREGNLKSMQNSEKTMLAKMDEDQKARYYCYWIEDNSCDDDEIHYLTLNQVIDKAERLREKDS